MDLASSMGIPKDNILQRGIVLLALVRMLVEHRSVELWVGTSLSCFHNGKPVSGTAAWRIDTTPLDLARSSFHIADPSMSRVFGYAMCETLFDRHLSGDNRQYEEMMAGLKETAGWSEVLMIPKIHIYDQMVTDPVGWVKNAMRKYVPQGDES
jgi:hypothetical protein